VSELLQYEDLKGVAQRSAVMTILFSPVSFQRKANQSFIVVKKCDCPFFVVQQADSKTVLK